MKDNRDIRDDEIRIIGDNGRPQTPPLRGRLLLVAAVTAVIAAAAAAIGALLSGHGDSAPEQPDVESVSYFEHQPEIVVPVGQERQRLGSDVDSLARGFCEIVDTTINDIPLRLFIPHNADMTLYVGRLDSDDDSIIYAAQAADIRRDNGQIVGAFVLEGEPLAWGLSKRGYCASIGGRVTVGVADNSPLFEQATERGGYFFRQYPLVDNGVVVDNEPKGKSIRRAICDRRGEIMMAATDTAESFHDFAQALADMGVDNAVYLVGSAAYGWAVDSSDERHEFGTKSRKLPRNTSYVVWRRR